MYKTDYSIDPCQKARMISDWGPAQYGWFCHKWSHINIGMCIRVYRNKGHPVLTFLLPRVQIITFCRHFRSKCFCRCVIGTKIFHLTQEIGCDLGLYRELSKTTISYIVYMYMYDAALYLCSPSPCFVFICTHIFYMNIWWRECLMWNCAPVAIDNLYLQKQTKNW